MLVCVRIAKIRCDTKDTWDLVPRKYRVGAYPRCSKIPGFYLCNINESSRTIEEFHKGRVSRLNLNSTNTVVMFSYPEIYTLIRDKVMQVANLEINEDRELVGIGGGIKTLEECKYVCIGIKKSHRKSDNKAIAYDLIDEEGKIITVPTINLQRELHNTKIFNLKLVDDKNKGSIAVNNLKSILYTY